ncbi:MAG TPA: amino acid--tRNA ligase-related protein, partial [Polyangia bacterium]
MSDERELIAERERKVNELRQAGQNPYANGFSPAHTAQDVHAWFASGNLPGANPQIDEPKAARFSVAGRIVAWRSFGKAAFAKVRDRSGEIQVWVKQDVVGEKVYGLWRTMERGDFIGAVGPAVITKTGEHTILAEQLVVLTKAVRPLPEKFHGLQDMEIRYRQRYVDLVSNPEVREVFLKRTAIVKHLRHFLDARDFVEVETPSMHTVLGGAAARPFRTHHNALDMDLTMRIAPELHLKRLVVGGFDRVYEIGRNFRNEGLSRQHNPEFTMLEFYQAYATYEDLMT